jgi:hypothetical protein
VHNIDRSPLDVVADRDDVDGVGMAIFEFLRSTSAQAVIWIAILLVLCAIGAYVVIFFRNRGRSSQSSASELLTSFRQLHNKGGISRTEFREIKSVLGTKIQDELDSSDAEREG